MIRGVDSKVFINSVALYGKTTSMSLKSTVNVIGYNVLKNNGNLKLPGIGMFTFNLNGLWLDYGDSSFEKLHQSNLQTETARLLWMIESTPPVGGCFIGSFPSSYKVDTPLDNLISIQGTWENVDSICNGYIVANEQTYSSTGEKTGIDFGALTTTGGKAILVISSIVGTATNAQIKLQSDDNSGHSSTADEGTFTFSAVGVYELTLSGTVDRYIRPNVVTLGGATSFVATILVGLNGVTQ